MNTVFLTDAELEKTRQGMTSFLRNFSDDEADTVYAIRSVPTRLSEARPDQDPPGLDHLTGCSAPPSQRTSR